MTTRTEPTEHRGHNEVRDHGIIHVCSCGWESRECFSSIAASVQGMEHRTRTKQRTSEAFDDHE